jgi:glutamate-1-semialdehyde 2,1-aminomutase
MTSRLAPGGMQEIHGVLADLTTLGKYVGGGMSFGAFGGKGSLMAIFDPRAANHTPHAGTFNNNTLTMSAGIAALSEIYTPEVARAHNAQGDALRQALNGIAARRDVPVVATGKGTMMAIHPARHPPRNASDVAATDQLAKELLFLDLLERGYYIARRGMIGLSLVVGEAELAGFRDAFDEVLALRAPLLRRAPQPAEAT